MLVQASFAFYGKLPWVGDFIARQISFDQQQKIDLWLTVGFSAMQEQYPHWLDSYLSAPVWCFLMPAGIWGSSAVIGVLMPSVDRVGRYFPFVAFFAIDDQKEITKYKGYIEQLEKIVPELLHNEIFPDDVQEYICSKLVQLEVSFLDDVILPQLAIHFLPTSEDASYWWRSDGASIVFDSRTKPDADFFMQLFGR